MTLFEEPDRLPKYMNRIGVLFCALSLGACSFNVTDPIHTGIAGGAGGAALGAGTGALIGSVISAGDVGASALLGAGVGLPIGAGIGYYYVATKNKRELAALDAEIESNQSIIDSTEAELIEARRIVLDGSYSLSPDASQREELYTGPTLGNPRR